MGLLDNYTGIGMSPRPQWQHQFVILDLLVNVASELPRSPAMEYWVFDYEAGQLWTLDADNRRWLLDDGTAGSAYLHRPMIDYFYYR